MTRPQIEGLSNQIQTLKNQADELRADRVVLTREVEQTDRSLAECRQTLQGHEGDVSRLEERVADLLDHSQTKSSELADQVTKAADRMSTVKERV